MISRVSTSLNLRITRLKEDEKGFTLIELLVVVIIIGILAAIAIPVYLGIQGNAKESGVKADVNSAKVAVVAWQTDHNGVLPTALAGLSSYGYSPPAQGNYKTGGLPVLTLNTGATGFSICATSVTDKVFGAGDASGVAAGSCASGLFTPTP